jgi:hypothetical protein
MDHSVAFTGDKILTMMEDTNSNELNFHGDCYDCGKEINIKIGIKDIDTGEYFVEGGAIWSKTEDFRNTTVTTFTLKCPDCWEKDNKLHDQECEVFARCVGYLTPVKNWNLGKSEEFKNRKLYDITKTTEKGESL